MVVHGLGDDQAPGSVRTHHLLVPLHLEPGGGRPHRVHTLIEFHQEQFWEKKVEILEARMICSACEEAVWSSSISRLEGQ